MPVAEPENRKTSQIDAISLRAGMKAEMKRVETGSNLARGDRYTGAMKTASMTTLRVRYAETDQMGVVYYANYFVWCEIGRVEFLRQLGFDYKAMEVEHGCMLPVVEASCRYKAPARYDDEVVIETRVAGLRQSLIRFAYRMLRAGSGDVLAEAETVHVVVNMQMQKQPMPAEYAAAIRATMHEASPEGALT